MSFLGEGGMKTMKSRSWGWALPQIVIPGGAANHIEPFLKRIFNLRRSFVKIFDPFKTIVINRGPFSKGSVGVWHETWKVSEFVSKFETFRSFTYCTELFFLSWNPFFFYETLWSSLWYLLFFQSTYTTTARHVEPVGSGPEPGPDSDPTGSGFGSEKNFLSGPALEIFSDRFRPNQKFMHTVIF